MDINGIYITNPAMKLKNKKDLTFKSKMIGKAFKTDFVQIYFEKHSRENMNPDDYKKEKGDGKIFNEQAGSGKTYKLCEMVPNTEKPLVLAFTNKAIEVFCYIATELIFRCFVI